ncbi:hypothetical protein J40TS1_51280 [Paenibacillus montaniterrae]|uniref:Uncharacterized protein n=1 Tax=Paenibacillus montaniterrae TaxID=429341 RepID=A0A919YVW3_9BACL|nr:hypothetical protein [Paenibacillus montaniterrae]GIP19486.1 hypothetical protein J40TS1_51280 [Paenibacillus montaniterrae]
MKKYKGYIIISGLIIFIVVSLGVIFVSLDFRDSDLYKKIRTYMIFRNDVNKIYKDTPFIFQAGKEVKLNSILSDVESKLDELYETTPFLELAKEGDGGIIKNKDAPILPYSFRYDLYSYLYSSALDIPKMDRIRLAIYGENDSNTEKDVDSYIDVTLFVDDINYGTHRFKTGLWGYADWYSIPNGSMKIVISQQENTNGASIKGIGAILID